jgi:putative spermidine/putrescine transport system permease protein
LQTSDDLARSIVNADHRFSGATVLSTVIGTLAALGLRRELVPFPDVLRSCSCCRWWCRRWCSASACRFFMRGYGAREQLSRGDHRPCRALRALRLVNVSGSLGGIDRFAGARRRSLGAQSSRCFGGHLAAGHARRGLGRGLCLRDLARRGRDHAFRCRPESDHHGAPDVRQLRENVSPAVAAAAFVIIILTFALVLAVKGAGLANTLRRKRQPDAA